MVPRIEIKTKGVISPEILIDGKKIDKVRSLKLEMLPGKLPILSLDFVASDLYLESDFLPALPDVFMDYYTRKPPSQSEGGAEGQG